MTEQIGSCNARFLLKIQKGFHCDPDHMARGLDMILVRAAIYGGTAARRSYPERNGVDALVIGPESRTHSLFSRPPVSGSVAVPKRLVLWEGNASAHRRQVITLSSRPVRCNGVRDGRIAMPTVMVGGGQSCKAGRKACSPKPLAGGVSRLS